MAKPIEIRPVVADAREELKRRLDNAPLEHADALLSCYELVQQLHDTGVIDVLRGVLDAGDRVVEHAVSVVSQPETVRALRNLMVMGKILGSIDPELLHSVAALLPAEGESRAPEKPPSLFALLKQMNSEDSRRALAVTAALLEGAGRGLKNGAR
ncbi:DUF1641 domain-containing protein [Paracidobacterium acidisoli]|uniref:DUF1641 domain-containing protein n=1 Tax=Paracidobacterium acidisoli TaxID=2303751 RepID=A0A372IRY3_9BACT|nr:DUF1641 domain-containing protein [Paracidobacterium acidisoli]MBT9330556.1 DUF1641 domain-containing protein [Paracidobacterium acidisoli]